MFEPGKKLHGIAEFLDADRVYTEPFGNPQGELSERADYYDGLIRYGVPGLRIKPVLRIGREQAAGCAPGGTYYILPTKYLLLPGV